MAKTKPFSKDAKLLLCFDSLHKVSDLFLGTFFISFVMNNSINEILSVSIYQFFLHITLLAGFFIFANIVKKRDKVAVFRFNLVPRAICFLAVIFLGDAIVDWIIPMGILCGINAALYWSPTHLMIGEKVPKNQMAKFTGYRALLGGLTKVIAPVALGVFITVGSYVEMAMALLVFSCIELGMTFLMKPSMHRSTKKFDISGFWNCMMRFPIIRRLFSVEILRGIAINGVLPTIITMYTVYMFKTDMNLGIFTTIFSAVSIATAFLFGRFAKKSAFSTLLLISTIMALLGVGIFTIYTNPITFLIYNFVNVTAIWIIGTIGDVNMYNLSKSRCITCDHKTEYFAFRETALGIGRAISFLALMMVGAVGGYEWLRWYLVGLVIIIVLTGFVSIKTDKYIRN